MSYCQMLHSRQNDAAERPIVSATWALAALALLLLWQFLTVHYNRAGNWTALFLTGQKYTLPPELAAGTYRFPGVGYDGEMYRLVAHDPFLQRGYARYTDAPGERYRRILLPALAYVLAAGHQSWIDASYIVLIALFIFAGAYWLSRWAVLAGAHPAWALAFLLVPATLISMDRMTVDVALVAFTVAFAVYCRTGSWWKLFLVLLLACLVRETALLLVAGICLFDLLRRRFERVVLWASTSLPMFAWYFFIRRIFPGKTHFGAPTWFANKVGPGLLYRMIYPPQYPLPPALDAIARFADSLALAAILLASILAILLVLRAHPRGPLAISGLLFAALVFALTSVQYWVDVNGYARVISPLFILVALPSIARETRNAYPWWLGLVPPIVVDLRLGLQFTSQIGGVVRGLLHSVVRP
jgi:hypothetical protein